MRSTVKAMRAVSWVASIRARAAQGRRGRGRARFRRMRLLAAFCAILQRMAATDTGRELLGEERRELILRWLGAEGKVRASDLSLRLRVSLDTIRRDLQELSDAGLLRRVHGGALPPSPPGPDSFLERLPDDVAAKAAVAKAAVDLVRPGEVIAISGGTTTLEFARRLPDDLDATVIATNPHIAVALADHPHLTVDVVGGRLLGAARTVVGPDAVDALRRVRPDVCVLSACSLHPGVGMTLRDREEAAVVRAMVEGAGRVVSVTTASKLGSAGPYPVAAIERIDTLVSDAPDEELRVYRDLGIEVVRA
jgi:DeoR/GlpR family transcriptional regulator of sugar metabolism